VSVAVGVGVWSNPADGVTLEVGVSLGGPGGDVAVGSASDGVEVGVSDALGLKLRAVDAVGVGTSLLGVCVGVAAVDEVDVATGVSIGVAVAATVAVGSTLVAVAVCSGVMEAVGVAGQPVKAERTAVTSSSTVTVPFRSRSPGQSPPHDVVPATGHPASAALTSVTSSLTRTVASPFKSPGHPEHWATPAFTLSPSIATLSASLNPNTRLRLRNVAAPLVGPSRRPATPRRVASGERAQGPRLHSDDTQRPARDGSSADSRTRAENHRRFMNDLHEDRRSARRGGTAHR
jgi:hypothetical protein